LTIAAVSVSGVGLSTVPFSTAALRKNTFAEIRTAAARARFVQYRTLRIRLEGELGMDIRRDSVRTVDSNSH
jgi:hypothetical protein